MFVISSSPVEYSLHGCVWFPREEKHSLTIGLMGTSSTVSNTLERNRHLSAQDQTRVAVDLGQVSTALGLTIKGFENTGKIKPLQEAHTGGVFQCLGRRTRRTTTSVEMGQISNRKNLLTTGVHNLRQSSYRIATGLRGYTRFDFCH